MMVKNRINASCELSDSLESPSCRIHINAKDSEL